MPLELPYGIKRTNPGFVDEYYGTYTGLTQALNSIPSGIRIIGLTCGIVNGSNIIEYWFNGGIADINLIQKQASINLSGLTIPFSGITNTPTTLLGYGISSGDTLFDQKYLSISSGITIQNNSNNILNLQTGLTYISNIVSGNTNNISILNSGLTLLNNTVTGITLSLSALTYNRSSPATRAVGGVSIGDIITGYTLDALLEKVLAPYTAPTITNTVLTPNPSPFNQTGITYNVTFRWVKNTGTPNFVSAQVQYKKSSSSLWVNLPTTPTVINPTTEDASATVLINSGGTDNTSVQFQGIFTDASQVQTGNTVTATFSAYVAPSITLNIGTTPREVGNTSTNLTGTITRNSVNVNLSSYVIQYEINGSSSYNFITGATIGISIATINTTDNNSNTTATTIGYRALVTDTQQITTGSTQIISFFYRVFYGPNSTVPTGSTQVRALSNNQLSNAGNTFILNTGTAFVNFILALPPGKTLVSVIDLDALNLDITSQYVGSSFTVNDFAGNPVSTYVMYAMTQSVPYASSHRHSITIA